MPLSTVGELRAALIKERATWAPPEHLADDAKIPEYALGIPEGFPNVKELKTSVDLKKIRAGVPANPILAEPRARIGLLPKSSVAMLDETTRKRISPILKLAPAPLPGRPAVVDWRSRSGTSWVD